VIGIRGLPCVGYDTLANHVSVTKLFYIEPSTYSSTWVKLMMEAETYIDAAHQLDVVQGSTHHHFIEISDATHAAASNISIKSDNNLFKAVSSNPSHAPHSLLPRIKVSHHLLRARMHKYTSPPKDSKKLYCTNVVLII